MKTKLFLTGQFQTHELYEKAVQNCVEDFEKEGLSVEISDTSTTILVPKSSVMRGTANQVDVVPVAFLATRVCGYEADTDI